MNVRRVFLVVTVVLTHVLSPVAPQEESPYLIYGVRNIGIRKMDLNGDNPTTLIPSATCANDFDYDIRQGWLYWADACTPEILRANLTDGSGETLLIQGGSGEYFYGLALDWVNNRIYFSKRGMDQTINVYDITSESEQVFISGELGDPRAVAVDPINEWVYWSDVSLDKIERATMSGQNRQILRDSTTNFDPYFMTLDHVNQKLYWSDSPATRIESSNVDGTGYVLLTTGAHGALGVAHYNGTIYYTDEDFRGVNELAPDGTRTRLRTESFNTRGVEVIAYSARPIPDVDECSLGAAECGTYAICINTDGSYYCICRPGYTGDGVNCTQVLVVHPAAIVFPDDRSQDCLSNDQRNDVLNEIRTSTSSLVGASNAP